MAVDELLLRTPTVYKNKLKSTVPEEFQASVL